jgi:hypothetical protein
MRHPFLILRGGRRQLDALERLVRPVCLSREDALRRLDRAPGPIVKQNVGTGYREISRPTCDATSMFGLASSDAPPLRTEADCTTPMQLEGSVPPV